jgi:nicotinate-nucleotide adenylyltransferase
MRHAPRLGVLGGTFDPVHVGHLDAGDAALTALSLDQVLLIPAHDPPHRQAGPRASAYHRFALISLAVANRDRYRVSDMELVRPGPSYTADTLCALHADGWRPSQLFFIMGTDTCAEIATWSRFPSLLDLAHFVVIARPGTTIDQATARTPQLRARVTPVTPDALAGEGPTRVFVVEARTREVSSTAIRERLAASGLIDDLVPAPVARHILTHHLYGAVDRLHGEDEQLKD